jgi:hypothetical protein
LGLGESKLLPPNSKTIFIAMARGEKSQFFEKQFKRESKITTVTLMMREMDRPKVSPIIYEKRCAGKCNFQPFFFCSIYDLRWWKTAVLLHLDHQTCSRLVFGRLHMTTTRWDVKIPREIQKLNFKLLVSTLPPESSSFDFSKSSLKCETLYNKYCNTSIGW